MHYSLTHPPSALIPFKGSPAPTLGVEIELQIVNPETMALKSGSLDIMSRVGDHPRIKPELTQSTIEVITGICQTPYDAYHDLSGSMRELYAIGDEYGFTFASAGTHPFSSWSDQDIYPNERYKQLVQRIQWAARRLNIYGIHVHVGVGSGERAIAIGNALTYYIPHLLALSASSPFVDSEDSGLDSCRVKLFEVMPTAGLPYQLANYGEFQRFMNTLINAKAIQSIREIWWDIRPHPNYGTIELRICDAPATIKDCCALAALAQCIVVHLDRLYEQGYPLDALNRWIVRENKWRASRFGLDAEIITDNNGTQRALAEEIPDLLKSMQPLAEEIGCTNELNDIQDLLNRGNSSSRQRAVYEQTGDFKEVLRYLADQLRSDIEN